MDAGGLMPDDVIIGLKGNASRMPTAKTVFSFDGFPRTIPQADAMKAAGVDIDAVVDVDVPGTRTRSSSKRCRKGAVASYHVIFNPPKVARKDDVNGRGACPAR